MRTRINNSGNIHRRKTTQVIRAVNGQPARLEKIGKKVSCQSEIVRKTKVPRKSKLHRSIKHVHGPKYKKVVSQTPAQIEAARNLTAFAHFKKSDTCVLLGSGPSICDISEKEWEVLGKVDTCALNNWVYHPTFVPNFYFIEVKWYNYDLIKRRLAEKFEEYKKVVFLFPKGKGIRNPNTNITLPLKNVAEGFPTRIEYNIASRDRKRTHEIYTANYAIKTSKFTKSYDISITCVFEFLFRMGYKKI